MSTEIESKIQKIINAYIENSIEITSLHIEIMTIALLLAAEISPTEVELVHEFGKDKADRWYFRRRKD